MSQADPVGRSLSAGPATSTVRLYDTLERFWEGAGISVLWVVGCLPVVTAGSSTFALFRFVAERRNGNHRPVLRAYWDEFRRAPLGRAAGTVVTLLALAGVAMVLMVGLAAPDKTIAIAVQAAGLIGAAVVLGTLVTLLPLQAQVQEHSNVLPALRRAATIGLGRPMTTLAALALTSAVVVAAVLFPPLVLVIGWAWARLLLELSTSAVRSITARSGAMR